MVVITLLGTFVCDTSNCEGRFYRLVDGMKTLFVSGDTTENPGIKLMNH